MATSSSLRARVYVPFTAGLVNKLQALHMAIVSSKVARLFVECYPGAVPNTWYSDENEIVDGSVKEIRVLGRVFA